jgi:hypothetical protein
VVAGVGAKNRAVSISVIGSLRAAVLRADQQPYTPVWTSINPDACVFLSHDSGVNQGNNATFEIPLPLAGGIEEYGFEMNVGYDNSGIPMGLSVAGGSSGRGSAIQYPPGFVFDPNKVPIDQWPFDLCFSPIYDVMSDSSMFRKTADGYVFVLELTAT